MLATALFPFERQSNSKDFLDEEIIKNEPIIPENIPNESKQEYDLKTNEVSEIEQITNSKIICNIGYGGFSTVKLIFNHIQNKYFAMKVVSLL